jgi:hypothetical protein
MGTGIVRTIGIVCARCKIGMTNLVYNMRRFVCLERMTAAAGCANFRRSTPAASSTLAMARATARNCWPRPFLARRSSALIMSDNMLAVARTRVAIAQFVKQDIESWRPVEKVDLIFANAALHFVPNHHEFMVRLVSFLHEGGRLKGWCSTVCARSSRLVRKSRRSVLTPRPNEPCLTDRQSWRSAGPSLHHSSFANSCDPWSGVSRLRDQVALHQGLSQGLASGKRGGARPHGGATESAIDRRREMVEHPFGSTSNG